MLLGTFALSQEPSQEPKPPQHEETRTEPDRAGQPKQDEAKPPKHEQDKQEKEREKQETAKPSNDEARPMEHQQVERPQDHQAQQSRDEHARPAGKSARIPDEKFRASFGRQHTFVVSRPVIVEGQPRFQYSGYWFTIVDPWPAEWLYTDDVYVDYIDGEYFLFDLLHPGVRVAVFVVM